MKNAINWFEIPVTDFERAKKFYSVLLGEQVVDPPIPDDKMKYGILPYDMGGTAVGGAIVQMEGFVPSTEGSTVYLNGGEDLKIPLSRIEMAGGTVIMPKTSIGENGFMALFMDTEGNKVALHSMN